MAAQRKEIDELIAKSPDISAFRNGERYYTEKKSMLTEWAEAMGKTTPIGALEPQAINNHLRAVAKKRTNNTSNKHLKHIKTFFEWFQTENMVYFNPVAPIKKRKHIKQKPYTPPAQDVLKVLKKCPIDDLHFFLLYFYTGARQKELFRAKFSDIKWQERLLRLGARKNRDRVIKYRWQPLNDGALASLMYFHQNKIEGQKHIIVSKHPRHLGKPYQDRNKILRTYCADAGVELFGYHAFRRAFLQVAGENPNVTNNQLKDLGRHAHLGTTSQYLLDLSPGLAEAAQSVNLDALIKRAKTENPTLDIGNLVNFTQRKKEKEEKNQAEKERRKKADG
jgi:integrase